MHILREIYARKGTKMNTYIFRFTDRDGDAVTRTVHTRDGICAAMRWFEREYPGGQCQVLDVDEVFRAAEERDEPRYTLTEKGENTSTMRDRIVAMIDQQRAKGLKKYGQALEENTTLTTAQRIEHAQEELIDALQYLEHLKATTADNLTVADYERAALRTVNPESAKKFDGRGLLLNAVMGLNGEAGEVIDHVKKALFQGHEPDREHLAEELGDVAWYLAVCCEAIGVPLEKVLAGNIEKLKARYPEGFDKARSINREEAQKND